MLLKLNWNMVPKFNWNMLPKHSWNMLLKLNWNILLKLNWNMLPKLNWNMLPKFYWNMQSPTLTLRRPWTSSALPSQRSPPAITYNILKEVYNQGITSSEDLNLSHTYYNILYLSKTQLADNFRKSLDHSLELFNSFNSKLHLKRPIDYWQP